MCPDGPDAANHAGSLVALLGPTNTGKTHRAIQRMLAHPTGMIGLPLRLLAREVYDRVVRERGVEHVALVTGEEKRVPPDARYWVCTVESMPVNRPVHFLAVDEVQLAADPERGHAFTDRILRARGYAETWFLGSDAMAPLLQELLPTVDVRSQPRLSRLSYAGPRKLTAVPRRSAVVAFSAARVYELAERIRARHGGVAVVLGALSPRTRNAQVAMFEAGEVDYLVATDAIGMGLNLDVHHVALAATTKFDGRTSRPLRADEVAQIAGRAGRHQRDGTFGETGGIDPLDPSIVDAVEAHRFEPVRRIHWRNPDLDFRSLPALLASLAVPPPRRVLVSARDADDARVLEVLATRPAVRARAGSAAAVRRVWDVCGIPDFAGVLPEHHAGLIEQILVAMVDHHGVLPDAFLDAQLARLDRPDGDVETLTARLAGIRTWTYVAHRGDGAAWVGDPRAWQARTREIEDRLSDALHARLTAKFVEHRLGVVVPGRELPAVTVDGSRVVSTTGHQVGELVGFDLQLDAGLDGRAERLVRAALVGELEARVVAIEAAGAEAWRVEVDGTVRAHGARVGKLVPDPLRPRVGAPRLELRRLDALTAPQRARLVASGESWLAGWVAEVLAWEVDGTPPERAILHALRDGLGVLPTRAVADAARALSADARRRLTRSGVTVGRVAVFHAGALAQVQARRALWAVAGRSLPDVAADAVAVRAAWGVDVNEALGFVPADAWRVRVDVFEALLAEGQQAADRHRLSREVWPAVRTRWGAPRGRVR